MSGRKNRESRRYTRLLSDWELTLSRPLGETIDDRAKAHDVSPDGFRAETKVRIEKGARLKFHLHLPEGQSARGQARVVWVMGVPWGGYAAGLKILKISWQDSEALGRHLYGPGYDFLGLARRAFVALYLVVVVLALENVLRHQPHARRSAWELWTVLLALAAMGLGLRELFRR